MVFFVCEGCNESMKKNQVDKHANRCRSCYAVTCVDCSVTFYGNDYATHLVCVSEAEKYEKTLYKAKVVTKLNPQEAWLSLIADAASKADEAPRNIRPYVLRLNSLGNVPRNKNKFSNFMKNSVKINNTSVIDDLWGFLESLKTSRDVESPVTATPEAVTDFVIENTPVDTSDVEKDPARMRKAERKRLREIPLNNSGTCGNDKQHGAEQSQNSSKSKFVMENTPVDTSDVEKDPARIRKAERKRLREIPPNNSGL